jgi:hypothetical protein
MHVIRYIYIECPVRVPAPGAAIVFLSQQFEDESFDTALTQTFPTTWYGDDAGPTVDAIVLETSNGRGGPQQAQFPLGSTSKSKAHVNDAVRTSVSLGFSLFAVAAGAVMVGRMLVQ